MGNENLESIVQVTPIGIGFVPEWHEKGVYVWTHNNVANTILPDGAQEMKKKTIFVLSQQEDYK